MPRLVNTTPQLPGQLEFSPVFRSIDSTQSLQNFSSNNSTAITSTNPSAISVRMNSSKWANFMSSYFQFDVTCSAVGSTGEVAALTQGVASLFRSMTILNNGVVIEQIREYATLSKLIAYSQVSPASTSNWAEGYEATATRLQTAAGGAVTAARRYTMQPLSGFLSSVNPVPLWAMGEIEIRLELSPAAEALFEITSAPGTALTLPEFTISNFKYKVELHDLPASYNQIVQRDIQESGLPFKLATYDMLTINIARNSSEEITISNNAKSVKSIWAVQRQASNLSNTVSEYNFLADGLSTHQLRIGGEHYPLEELDVGAPSWMEMVKSFQREGSYSSHYDITSAQYQGTFVPTIEDANKFIVGYDLEKFCGGGAKDLVCGTDFSENDIVWKLTYGTVPAVTGNRWYFYIYKDMTLTIVPGFNVVVNS